MTQCQFCFYILGWFLGPSKSSLSPHCTQLNTLAINWGWLLRGQHWLPCPFKAATSRRSGVFVCCREAMFFPRTATNPYCGLTKSMLQQSTQKSGIKPLPTGANQSTVVHSEWLPHCVEAWCFLLLFCIVLFFRVCFILFPFLFGRGGVP